MEVGWRAALGVACMAGLLGTGCYHAGKDAIARAAQADFKDARLGGSLDEELAHSRDMLKAELAAAKSSVEARRDEALARVLELRWGGAPVKGVTAPCAVTGGESLAEDTFTCEINRMVQRLATPPTAKQLPVAALEPLRESVAHAKNFEVELTRQQGMLPALLGGQADALSCPPSGEPDRSFVDRHPELKQFFDNFAQTCGKVQAARKGLNFSAAGLLGKATNEWMEEKKGVETQKAEASDLASAYQQARSNYDKAVKDRTARSDELKAGTAAAKEADRKVSEAAAAAKGALDALGKRAEANVFAAVDELRARYDGVVEGVGRIAEGRPKADSGLEIVLSTGLRLDEIRGAAGLPRLLLEAERLRGRLAIAQLRAEHAERRVELMGARRTALFDEAIELMNASADLDRARAGGGAGPQRRCDPIPDTATIYEALRGSKPACKAVIARALVGYANAYTVGEMRAGLAQARTLGDVHDQAVETSAEAVRMWENALAVPLDGVAERYASGVRPEELARLIVQAIGAGALVGIAVK